MLLALLGAISMLAGGYSVARPHSTRNWVAAGEWEADPERARANQRTYARAMGVFLLGLGLALVVIGLFPAG